MAKGLTALTGAAVVGQAITLAISPLLSRIYTPAEFGGFGVLVSLSMVLGYVLTLRMEAAVNLPEDEEEGRALALLASKTAIVAGAASLLVIPLVAHFTKVGGALSTVPFWPVALPVLSMLTAIGAAVSQFAIRQHVYQLVARVGVLGAVVASIAQVLVGLLSSFGLALGAIIGKIVGVPTMAQATKLLEKPVAGTTFGAGFLFRKYWRFPLIFMPAGLVNIAGGQLATLAIPLLYGLDQAGQYVMATRLLSIPATLMGLAAGSVFLGELARARHVGGDVALRMFFKWTRYLAIPAVLLVLVVCAVGPWVVTAFLGSQWSDAAQFSVILVWGIAAAFVAGPLDHVWTVYERAGLSFAWQLGRLAGTIAIFALAHNQDWVIERTLWAVSAWTFISYAASWFSCWRVLRSERGRWDEPSSDEPDEQAAAAMLSTESGPFGPQLNDLATGVAMEPEVWIEAEVDPSEGDEPRPS